MRVEIWADVMCPFCYIGKRRFEQALNEFEHKEDIEVEWKSFQLDSRLKTDPSKSVNQMLAEKKGWTIEYAREMNARVTDMARELGLVYDFDKAVVANSFNAHRLLQMAKKFKLGGDAEEKLFKAYFTEGKNIDSPDVLVQIGLEIGLENEELRQLLKSQAYADNVKMDIYEAQKIGARGVPFFLFNNKYAVSGAQAVQTFLNTLQTSWKEWNKQKEMA